MPVVNGTYYHLGSKVFWLSVLGGSVPATIVLLFTVLLRIVSTLVVPDSEALAALHTSLTTSIGAVILVAIILEAFGILIAWLKYQVSTVMLDDTSLHITRGLLSKAEFVLPYRRIQSVQIKQTFLFRMLGVGRLVVATTTDLDQTKQKNDDGDDQVVPLMHYDFARAVADILTNRAEVERMQVQQKVSQQ